MCLVLHVLVVSDTVPPLLIHPNKINPLHIRCVWWKSTRMGSKLRPISLNASTRTACPLVSLLPLNPSWGNRLRVEDV